MRLSQAQLSTDIFQIEYGEGKKESPCCNSGWNWNHDERNRSRVKVRNGHLSSQLIYPYLQHPVILARCDGWVSRQLFQPDLHLQHPLQGVEWPRPALLHGPGLHRGGDRAGYDYHQHHIPASIWGTYQPCHIDSCSCYRKNIPHQSHGVYISPGLWSCCWCRHCMWSG